MTSVTHGHPLAAVEIHVASAAEPPGAGGAPSAAAELARAPAAELSGDDRDTFSQASDPAAPALGATRSADSDAAGPRAPPTQHIPIGEPLSGAAAQPVAMVPTAAARADVAPPAPDPTRSPHPAAPGQPMEQKPLPPKATALRAPPLGALQLCEATGELLFEASLLNGHVVNAQALREFGCPPVGPLQRLRVLDLVDRGAPPPGPLPLARSALEQRLQSRAPVSALSERGELPAHYLRDRVVRTARGGSELAVISAMTTAAIAAVGTGDLSVLDFLGARGGVVTAHAVRRLVKLTAPPVTGLGIARSAPPDGGVPPAPRVLAVLDWLLARFDVGKALDSLVCVDLSAPAPETEDAALAHLAAAARWKRALHDDWVAQCIPLAVQAGAVEVVRQLHARAFPKTGGTSGSSTLYNFCPTTEMVAVLERELGLPVSFATAIETVGQPRVFAHIWGRLLGPDARSPSRAAGAGAAAAAADAKAASLGPARSAPPLTPGQERAVLLAALQNPTPGVLDLVLRGCPRLTDGRPETPVAAADGQTLPGLSALVCAARGRGGELHDDRGALVQTLKSIDVLVGAGFSVAEPSQPRRDTALHLALGRLVATRAPPAPPASGGPDRGDRTAGSAEQQPAEQQQPEQVAVPPVHPEIFAHLVAAHMGCSVEADADRIFELVNADRNSVSALLTQVRAEHPEWALQYDRVLALQRRRDAATILERVQQGIRDERPRIQAELEEQMRERVQLALGGQLPVASPPLRGEPPAAAAARDQARRVMHVNRARAAATPAIAGLGASTATWRGQPDAIAEVGAAGGRDHCGGLGGHTLDPCLTGERRVPLAASQAGRRGRDEKLAPPDPLDHAASRPVHAAGGGPLTAQPAAVQPDIARRAGGKRRAAELADEAASIGGGGPAAPTGHAAPAPELALAKSPTLAGSAPPDAGAKAPAPPSAPVSEGTGAVADGAAGPQQGPAAPAAKRRRQVKKAAQGAP
jgi:hypothetical protein